jgi:hypothetical protein
MGSPLRRVLLPVSPSADWLVAGPERRVNLSTAIFAAPIAQADPVAVPQPIHYENLASAIERLAALQFRILLTTRWHTSKSTTPERRAELRGELTQLGTQYFNLVDEIAMNHGVQIAMDATEEVERRVKVPSTARMPMRRDYDEGAWF